MKQRRLMGLMLLIKMIVVLGIGICLIETPVAQAQIPDENTLTFWSCSSAICLDFGVALPRGAGGAVVYLSGQCNPLNSNVFTVETDGSAYSVGCLLTVLFEAGGDGSMGNEGSVNAWGSATSGISPYSYFNMYRDSYCNGWIDGYNPGAVSC